MARGRSLAALPQREMLVVVDHGAATRRDLRVAVGQRRADEADMRGIGSVDVLLQCFRNSRQDILPSVGHLAGGYGHSTGTSQRVDLVPGRKRRQSVRRLRSIIAAP